MQRLFCNKIKQQDAFAKPIRLNFNKTSDGFETYLGGCLSIVIKITIVLYFGLLWTFLVLGSNDNFV